MGKQHGKERDGRASEPVRLSGKMKDKDYQHELL